MTEQCHSERDSGGTADWVEKAWPCGGRSRPGIASLPPAEPVIGVKKAWPTQGRRRPVIASATPAKPVIGIKKA